MTTKFDENFAKLDKDNNFLCSLAPWSSANPCSGPASVLMSSLEANSVYNKQGTVYLYYACEHHAHEEETMFKTINIPASWGRAGSIG